MEEKKPWRLIFESELLENFLSGKECLDIRIYRKGSNNFRKWQVIEGHFQVGIMILLEVMADTKVKRFGDITPEECAEWGKFNHPDMSHSEMMENMRVYYPSLTEDHMAAINLLELPEIDGRRIAGTIPEDAFPG